MLFIDLDGFKPVNDGLGQAVGDEVLQIIAQRLRRTLRRSDSVARFGGDEFAVLLGEVTDERDAGQAAEQLIRVLQAPITVAGQEVEVGGSVGVATYPASGRTGSDLLKAADTAMYRAKEQEPPDSAPEGRRGRMPRGGNVDD